MKGDETVRIWGYSFNENKGAHDQVRGSKWWAGRAFLHVDRKQDQRWMQFRSEWGFGSRARHTGLYFRLQDVEVEFVFFIGIAHLFSLWFSIEPPPALRKRLYRVDRRIGFRIFDGALWIDGWVPENEWRRGDRRWTIRPADLLFGKEHYKKHPLGTHRATVFMPEGDYLATVELFESEWKRPRGWARRIQRATITPDTPIPIPGKGENSWDIDDDAIHSSTMPARTVADAVAGLYASVMNTRERHGGKNWMPEKGARGWTR